jgi:glycerol-3-phosphate O-acyltransferase
MNWTVLDDSVKAFRSQSATLKRQGNYNERLGAYLIAKKLLSRFRAQIYTSGLEQFQRARESGRRVLLVPNHRSYFDPVIVHHILALQGLPQPRVAALDFLAKTPIAPVLQRCGAVFIKGNFSDPDYRERMNEQFRQYADQGEWVEFYLEGQRSVSGKQLPPRRGLIKALTADQPCLIFPITLSFERVIEDKDLTVRSKPFKVKTTIESLCLPSHGIGKIFFAVGEPVLTEPHSDPRHTAQLVSTRIVRNNVIFPSDLVALLLLDREEPIARKELEAEVQWLTSALRHRGLEVTDSSLEETLHLLSHVITVKKRLVSIKSKGVLLYYRNRALYTLFDLVETPDLLRLETQWTPNHKPRFSDRKTLRTIARRADPEWGHQRQRA